MSFFHIGRKPVPVNTHHMPPKEEFANKLALGDKDFKDRILRLDKRVNHNSSSEESARLFVMGGKVFRSFGESDMYKGHAPIGTVINRFTLESAELNEASVIREIESASSTKGVETYIKYKTSYADGADIVDYGKAELLIVKIAANGSGQ